MFESSPDLKNGLLNVADDQSRERDHDCKDTKDGNPRMIACPKLQRVANVVVKQVKRMRDSSQRESLRQSYLASFRKEHDTEKREDHDSRDPDGVHSWR